MKRRQLSNAFSHLGYNSGSVGEEAERCSSLLSAVLSHWGLAGMDGRKVKCSPTCLFVRVAIQQDAWKLWQYQAERVCSSFF